MFKPPLDMILESRRPRFCGWRLSPSDLDAVAGHARASEWTSMEFMGARFGDGGLPPLSRLPALEELSLQDCAISAGGVSQLASLAPRLTWLSLSGNGLGPAAATALARLSFPSLSLSLELSDNPLGDGGARALADLDASPEELDLSFVGLGPDGLAALVKSPLFRGLRHLRLTGNPLGDAGAAALASWGPSELPLGLDLAWTGVGEAGLRALYDGGVLARCTRLDLRGLEVSEAGLRWLADLALPRLSMLSLERASQPMRDALTACYQRVTVNELDPQWVVACPYCQLETSVHDPICARCGGDTSRDSGLETTPAQIAAQPTVPCPHCHAPVAESAMRCPSCRSWVPSARERSRAVADPSVGAGAAGLESAGPSPSGPAQGGGMPASSSSPAASSRAVPLVLAGGCGCLLLSGCVLTAALSLFGS